MPTHKLILLLRTRPPPKRPLRTNRRALPFRNIGCRGVRSKDVAVVRPPAEENEGAAEDEADESYEDPVASHLWRVVRIVDGKLWDPLFRDEGF
jgi:hypothetical protein